MIGFVAANTTSHLALILLEDADGPATGLTHDDITAYVSINGADWAALTPVNMTLDVWTSGGFKESGTSGGWYQLGTVNSWWSEIGRTVRVRIVRTSDGEELCMAVGTTQPQVDLSHWRGTVPAVLHDDSLVPVSAQHFSAESITGDALAESAVGRITGDLATATRLEEVGEVGVDLLLLLEALTELVEDEEQIERPRFTGHALSAITAGGGGGLTLQQIRNALTLAATSAAVAGSIDHLLLQIRTRISGARITFVPPRLSLAVAALPPLVCGDDYLGDRRLRFLDDEDHLTGLAIASATWTARGAHRSTAGEVVSSAVDIEEEAGHVSLRVPLTATQTRTTPGAYVCDLELTLDSGETVTVVGPGVPVQFVADQTA